MITRDEVVKELKEYFDIIGEGKWQCITVSCVLNKTNNEIEYSIKLNPKKVINGLNDVFDN